MERSFSFATESQRSLNKFHKKRDKETSHTVIHLIYKKVILSKHAANQIDSNVDREIAQKKSMERKTHNRKSFFQKRFGQCSNCFSGC